MGSDANVSDLVAPLGLETMLSGPAIAGSWTTIEPTSAQASSSRTAMISSTPLTSAGVSSAAPTSAHPSPARSLSAARAGAG